jgi:hypothetical protein
MAVRKRAPHNFDGERFNVTKLNDQEVRKQYHIQITDRFAALENLRDDEDINRAWESMKGNIKTSASGSLGLYELKQHTCTPWFDEECLGILDRRKQAKIHWIQDPSRNKVDNLNNLKRNASRHFRNNKKKHI